MSIVLVGWLTYAVNKELLGGWMIPNIKPFLLY